MAKKVAIFGGTHNIGITLKTALLSFSIILTVSCSSGVDTNSNINTQQEGQETSGVTTTQEDPTPSEPPPPNPSQVTVNVRAITPEGGRQDVVLRPTIEVELEEGLSDQIFYSLEISISPMVTGNVVRDPVRNKISYPLTGDLQPEQNYTISLLLSSQVVATSTFRTMGGLAILQTTPAMAPEEISPLNTAISVSYSPQIAAQMTSISAMLTIDGGGSIIGNQLVINNSYSGSWQPINKFRPNERYQITLVTTYTDPAGIVRTQTNSWSFMTANVRTIWISEPLPHPNRRDNGFKVKFGQISGDIYLVGNQSFRTAERAVIYFARLDGRGNKKWERFFEDTSNYGNSIYDIEVDEASGELFIAGSNILPGANNYDQMLLKYSTDGEYIWRASHNSGLSRRDWGHSLAMDANNVYLVGIVPEIANIGSSEGTIRAYSRTDSPPRLIWSYPESELLPGNDDSLTSVAATSNGIIAAGVKVSDSWDIRLLKFNPANGAMEIEGFFPRPDMQYVHKMFVLGSDIYLVGETNTTNTALFIAKYTIGAGSFNEGLFYVDTDAIEGMDISVKDVGGDRLVYVTGNKNGPGGVRNAFVRVYKDNGTAGFTVLATPDADFDVAGISEGLGLAVDNGGGFVVTGNVPYSANQPEAGERDIFLRRYSYNPPPAGSFSINFSETINGRQTGRLGLSTIASMPNGDYVVGGFYATPSHTFVQRYSSVDGTAAWPARHSYHPPPELTTDLYYISQIKTDSDGNIYLCGSSPHIIPNPNPTCTGNNAEVHNSDIFFDKLNGDGVSVLPGGPYSKDWRSETSCHYFGDSCSRLAVDSSGYIYLGGYTMPTGETNVFVTRLCPNGSDSPSCGAWKKEINTSAAGNIRSDMLMGLNSLSDRQLFVGISSADYSSLARRQYIFYFLNAENGRDFYTGEEALTPIAPPVETSRVSYAILDRDNNVVFTSFNGLRTRIQRVSATGTITPIAELNEDFPGGLVAIDPDGNMFLKGSTRDTNLVGASAYHGPQTIQTLLILRPDGSELARKTLDINTYSTTSGDALILPDNTISFVGSAFVLDDGISGFIKKCDLLGNCVE